MNEPASFGTNEERPFNWPEDDKPYWSLNCTLEGSTIEHPPYRTSEFFIQTATGPTILITGCNVG